MATEDPNDLNRVDQEIRINELKCQIEQVTGQPWQGQENPDAPPEMMEEFYQHVLEYESAAGTCLHEKLSKAGVALPPAEELTDEQIAAKLAEIFQALATMRCFFTSTDHLSDRELYIEMIEDSFHEWMADYPVDEYSGHYWDLVSSGSDEDTDLYLRYYADDKTREQWASQFKVTLPPKEKPPHDRDRHLPQG